MFSYIDQFSFTFILCNFNSSNSTTNILGGKLNSLFRNASFDFDAT